MVATEVRLAELLGSLSLATDLGAGVPPESAVRTAYLAVAAGRALGLPDGQLSDVYYAALLRYLGCTAYAHESAQLGGGDDRALLHALEAADPARPVSVLGAVVTQVAREAPLPTRVASIVRVMAKPSAYRDLAAAHCAQAVALARAVGVRGSVLRAIGEMYERYDGRGQPQQLAGEAISLTARVVHLANLVEVQARHGGLEGALAEVRRRRGTHVDPRVADAFLAVADSLLPRLATPSLWDDFLEAEPAPRAAVREEDLDAIARAFAQYVDLKSPYTGGHSTSVAELTRAAGGHAGLSEPECETLYRAGLVHDLGRASVANGIWDKPGPLNAVEQEQARLHAYHSERILRRAGVLDEEAGLAGLHHERADGSGAHRGLRGTDISLPAALLAAADVYCALREERAYRPGRSTEEAASVLRAEAQTGRLATTAVEAVLAAAGHRTSGRARVAPAGLSEREVEVLCLLARGLSNKQIASRLVISPRTVQVHVRHIYEKTGVETRAAAALFAVTRGLVGV